MLQRHVEHLQPGALQTLGYGQTLADRGLAVLKVNLEQAGQRLFREDIVKFGADPECVQAAI